VPEQDGPQDAISRARAALSAARATARAKGLRPAPVPAPQPPEQASEQPETPPPGRKRRLAGQGRPGFAARPPGNDPQPLSSAISGLLDAEGWALAAATGSVFGRWAEIVGADLAAHTTPETLKDGELTVSADSTAWATQLRLLASQLVKRLNAELGDGTVLRVRVRGPVSGSPRPGEWRVRGSRGPRDTYG
jgi:predicted nucleic acid-binding Zn ribbon protein